MSLEKKIRLNRPDDIQRVRQKGKSFSHPLLVLIVLSDFSSQTLKVGIIATKSVGGAVARNRAKRLLRESVQPWLPQMRTDIHAVLIARKPLLDAELETITDAVRTLLTKANALKPAE